MSVEAPVKIPVIAPTIAPEPLRRLAPGEVCPTQKEDIGIKIRRLLP